MKKYVKLNLLFLVLFLLVVGGCSTNKSEEKEIESSSIESSVGEISETSSSTESVEVKEVEVKEEVVKEEVVEEEVVEEKFNQSDLDYLTVMSEDSPKAGELMQDLSNAIFVWGANPSDGNAFNLVIVLSDIKELTEDMLAKIPEDTLLMTASKDKAVEALNVQLEIVEELPKALDSNDDAQEAAMKEKMIHFSELLNEATAEMVTAAQTLK